MTWHEIANSIVADNSDINDNFDHVGSGSRNPLSSAGSSFSPTTSVYDIGSDAIRFQTMYCNNIHSNTIPLGFMRFVTDALVSATTSQIEFTGLDGVSSKYFCIIGRIFVDTTANLFMYFNNDSAANYSFAESLAIDNSTSVFRTTTASNIVVCKMRNDTSTSEKNFFVIDMYTNHILPWAVSYGKVGRVMSMSGVNTYCHNLLINGFVYASAVDTITSIKFITESGNLLTDSYISIWEKN